MEKQNNYYTPTIDEFYIGFEFEHMDINTGRWNKHIFGSTYMDEFTMIQMDLNDGLLMVKYLDKEDIESLGWVFDSELSNDVFDRYEGLFENMYYFLQVYHTDQSVVISFPISILIYRLVIKNKSEFKRLMKQLGI